MNNEKIRRQSRGIDWRQCREKPGKWRPFL